MENTYQTKIRKERQAVKANTSRLSPSCLKTSSTKMTTNRQQAVTAHRTNIFMKNLSFFKYLHNEKWSQVMPRFRLCWLVHVHRLPETSPAKQAQSEAQRDTKNP